MVRHATTIQPFEELPDDCAGDVLEYQELAMTRKESLQVAALSPSPEANLWARAVIEAAIAVSLLALSSRLLLDFQFLVCTLRFF